MSDFIRNIRVDTGNTSTDRKDSETVFTTGKGTVVAKKLGFDLVDTKRQRYLVATHLGGLYDPDGGYSTREHKINFQFKSVSKTTFEHYVRFLENHKRVSFIAAERSFLNGN